MRARGGRYVSAEAAPSREDQKDETEGEKGELEFYLSRRRLSGKPGKLTISSEILELKASGDGGGNSSQGGPALQSDATGEEAG